MSIIEIKIKPKKSEWYERRNWSECYERKMEQKRCKKLEEKNLKIWNAKDMKQESLWKNRKQQTIGKI